MEGPSLTLAREQLAPFNGKTVRTATGNTKLDKTRFVGRPVKDIFAWGKHLVLQFDTFALRIHFLLWGSFEAVVDGVRVTGDYARTREPRLALTFDNGRLDTFNCSLKILDTAHARRLYDFTRDIMAKNWDSKAALSRVKAKPEEEIADVLLDQEIFSGVGNIIKNEVLSQARIHPEQKAGALSDDELADIIARTRAFSRQFYRWRKRFVLKKNLLVHGRGTCPHCQGKLTRRHTGKRERRAFWCPVCQPLRKPAKKRRAA